MQVDDRPEAGTVRAHFQKMIRILDRPLRFLEAVGVAIAMLCMLGLIGFTSADVIGRYVFSRAQGWVHDTALVLMIGLCFLSLAPLQARMGNVAVQVFYYRMRMRRRRVTLCLQLAIGILAAGIIGWRNSLYAWEAWQMGWIYSGFGRIPTAVPYGFIGIGCLLLMMRMIVQFLQTVSGDPAAEAMLKPYDSRDFTP